MLLTQHYLKMQCFDVLFLRKSKYWSLNQASIIISALDIKFDSVKADALVLKGSRSKELNQFSRTFHQIKLSPIPHDLWAQHYPVIITV